MTPPRPTPRDMVDEDWTAEDVAQLRPGRDSIADFRAALVRAGGIAGSLWFAASGREALRRLLLTLPRDAARTDVLMSAFNCPVVPKAVRAAGYRPVFYDFRSLQGEVDWEEVAGRMDSRVAAVLVSHFFGAPADAEAIRIPARQAGIPIIEDCAHAFGASVRGRAVGSLWDAAIFSFNYGKPISLGGGAAVVLNEGILRDLAMPDVMLDDEAVERREIAAYLRSAAAGRAAITPVPAPVDLGRRVLRRLGLVTPVTPPLAQGIGPVRAALGLVCLSRWPATQAVRNANAARIAAGGIPLWHHSADVAPSWLRLRVTLRDRRAVEDASRLLRSHGLRAGNLNWPAMEPDARRMGQAARVAALGIDAPIHQNMTEEELGLVAEVLASRLAGA